VHGVVSGPPFIPDYGFRKRLWGPTRPDYSVTSVDTDGILKYWDNVRSIREFADSAGHISITT